MTDAQALQVATNLHCRIIVDLVDAVMRADNPDRRKLLLDQIRDEAIDHRRETTQFLSKVQA